MYFFKYNQIRLYVAEMFPQSAGSTCDRLTSERCSLTGRGILRVLSRVNKICGIGDNFKVFL